MPLKAEGGETFKDLAFCVLKIHSHCKEMHQQFKISVVFGQSLVYNVYIQEEASQTEIRGKKKLSENTLTNSYFNGIDGTSNYSDI